MCPGRAAGADASRPALVIGNNAYRRSPLLNPANDARAMTALLELAGFTVDSQIDANHDDMMTAIERFGTTIRMPGTKQVVFYYAGHAVQLDWRNYLLPVDADVTSAEQIKQRCVDLNQLIGTLSGAGEKTFIIMLDACRNNPFGSRYVPEQKGLSQFDAPAGSLIAYATAPGKVASDGAGKNGLYTEHLLKELAVRDARIEDALKRVRLNVRLASGSAQIPWETTSLESDVFLFPDRRKKLSESELERQVAEDLAAWNRVKSSKKAEDWVSYLREFPNGRFAEIAQLRLDRLIAESKVASPAVPASAPEAAAAPFALVLPNAQSGGSFLPKALSSSENPYSAGRFPLGRVFSVGDGARYRVTDILSGIEERKTGFRVTRVDADRDIVELNEGRTVLDSMGNFMRNPNLALETPRQFTPAELFVGKKWITAFAGDGNGGRRTFQYDFRIALREMVEVPAGKFLAFLAEGEGWIRAWNANYWAQERIWIVPGLNFPVKHESIARQTNSGGLYYRAERHELLSLRQRVLGLPE